MDVAETFDIACSDKTFSAASDGRARVAEAAEYTFSPPIRTMERSENPLRVLGVFQEQS